MTKTDMTANEIAQDDLIDLGKASVATLGGDPQGIEEPDKLYEVALIDA
ncbi:MAG: hypothetical protein ACTHLA_13500 [Asticcacaulis sp.]